MQGCKRTSFLDRLGWWGVMRVVWKAIPWQFRVFVFPHFLYVYGHFFKICTNLDEVRGMHSDYYHKSWVFKIFRPRFHMIKRALLPLDMTHSDVAVREAAKIVRPVAWIPKEAKVQSYQESPHSLLNRQKTAETTEMES